MHFCHITNLSGQIYPGQGALPACPFARNSRRLSMAPMPMPTFPFNIPILTVTTTGPVCTNG
jgi:hypothetical protein